MKPSKSDPENYCPKHDLFDCWLCPNTPRNDISFGEMVDHLQDSGMQVIVIDENTDFSKLPDLSHLKGEGGDVTDPLKGKCQMNDDLPGSF